MDSLIETTQVVAVLALLPFILVCLLIIEPLDHIRFPTPKPRNSRMARRQTRPRPVVDSELA